MDHSPPGRVIAGILPPFLRLPYEIRLIIYNYALLVDYEIIPYPSPYRVQKPSLKFSRLQRRFLKYGYFTHGPSSPKLPSLNLLAVNKQIFEETAPILYGKNTWRMPVVAGGKLFRWRDHNVFIRHAELFRHISVKFDWRGMTDLVYHGYLYHKGVSNSEWCEYEYPWHRGRVFHSDLWETVQNCSVLHKIYGDMSQLLPHVTSLVVDVDQLYCARGCCRGKVLGRWLRNGFVASLGKDIMNSSLSRVVFTGLKSAEEKEIVYLDWGFEEPGIVSNERLRKRWADEETELDRLGAHQGDDILFHIRGNR